MKLRLYQKTGLRFLIRQKQAALFWHMRLGKTITTVKAARVLRGFPCLIIAPYSAFDGWIKEVGIKDISTIVGTRKERLTLLQRSTTNWVLINKEGFLSVPEISDYRWMAIILDESTCIKNPRTKISKFYTRKFKDVPVKFILTGTPAIGSDLDYIQQLIFLDQLKMDYWKFIHYHCYLAGFKYELKASGKKILTESMKHCASFLSLKDVNLNSEKIYKTYSVELPRTILLKYKDIIDKFKIDDSNFLLHKPVAFSYALQFLGGFINKKLVNDRKLLALKTLLYEQLPTQTKKIIFAIYKNELYILKNNIQRKMGGGSVEIISGDISFNKRMNIINRFQSGDLKIIVCQPETVKHGLDLSAADEIIFYSSPLSLETRYQCESRAGINKSIYIIDLVCRNTIEEDIIKSMRIRENRSQMMKRIVRRLQNDNS